MIKKFISVPTKLLILIILTLLILAIGFSTLSLSRLQDDYKAFHQNTLAQGQVHFTLHTEILHSKINAWLESFAEIIQLAQQDDPTVFVEQLAEQFGDLQLSLNIENVWVVDSNNKALFTTSTIPKFAQDNIEQVLTYQNPTQDVLCQAQCYLFTSIPLMSNNNMFVVTMAANLVDILYAISTSLGSEVAVVSYALQPTYMLPATITNDIAVISASNMALTHSLLNTKNNINIAEVLEQGLKTNLKNKNYLVNLLPLATNNQRAFYLSLIDDVTNFEVKNSRYRQHLLLSLSGIFLVLAFFLYCIARLFTQRLLRLSDALPLLANKKFEQFRQVELKRPMWFSDELDILTDSALELSYELEQLNRQVEQKTKELKNIAMHDSLTGLPNRNMLDYQLRKLVENIERNPSGIAILFLDLDDFKKVNDSNGHTEGDKLLIQAATRIRASIGKMDLACRFGGDEFVVVLGGLTSVTEAVIIAEKLLKAFKEPIKLGSSIFYVSTSIGISYTESSHEIPEDLISHADIAMYEAKDNGGSQFYIYHQAMFQRIAHRVLLEGEVRQALAKNQFSLSLQPQLRAVDHKIYGFEALLRWQHPERGMVAPEDFLSILENSQHMIELGYWILNRCFELMVILKEQGLTEVKIAINLSAGQFIDSNLPRYLQHLLDKFSLSANRFEFELTEQTLVKEIDHTITMMNTLKSMGFSFAIDDFGTGYSSLAYLRSMPLDVIKIDKSFVFGMLENHVDYQIIMLTITMAQNLGLIVIAEGVETEKQLHCLSNNNCDLIQGFYFSKPVPETELVSFIKCNTHEGYWKK